MSDSFQPLNYYTTSDDKLMTGFIAQDIITIDPNIATMTGSVTVPSSYYSYSPSTSTITITNGGSGYSSVAGGATVNIGNINTSTFTWKTPEEFVDSFPDFDRIQKMCEQYPGLKIAYEKFATTYRLVKDEYDNPTTKK